MNPMRSSNHTGIITEVLAILHVMRTSIRIVTFSGETKNCYLPSKQIDSKLIFGLSKGFTQATARLFRSSYEKKKVCYVLH